MSATEARQAGTAAAADLDRLHEYHDGELGGMQRWLFERRLRRDPSLQEALAELRELGDLLRADEAELPLLGQSPEQPSVWASIAGNLDAVDAQVESERAAGQLPAAEIEDERPPAWWVQRWKIGAALASAAAVAMALLMLTPQTVVTPAPDPGLVAGTVRYLDASGRSVMVIDDEADAFTVLWMMDEV